MLLGVFKTSPFAVTLKGVPLEIPRTPLICQSLMIDRATPP
jgi:hypothetical protein